MKIPVSLLLLLLAGQAIALDSLPRLELGASLFALTTPDYRGSRSESSYLIPIPYIKYRSERLRVDDGAQGIFLKTDDLVITISGNLSPPVDDDIPEREGMDQLEGIFEIGPSFNFRLHQMPHSAWWLDLPFRVAITLDGEFDEIGHVFQPRLSWRQPAKRTGDWKLRFNIGPFYASDRYHEYFYSVGAEEATSSRSAYDADSGFSGMRSEFTYSKRFGRLWLGGFVRYDSLKNSEVEDSPLVLEDTAWVGGIALGWIFHER